MNKVISPAPNLVSKFVPQRQESQKPSALVVTTEIPLPYGSGAAVRSYFFISSLIATHDITLVITRPDQGTTVPELFREACHLILPQASPHGTRRANKQQGRLASWGNILRIMKCAITQNESGYLYRLAESLEISLRPDTKTTPSSRKQRLLRTIIRLELDLLERWKKALPYITFHHWSAFESMRPNIENMAPAGGYDLIWYEHSFMHPLMQDLSVRSTQSKLICNSHNIEHALHLRNAQTAPNKTLFKWLKRQAEILRKVETACFNEADLIFACSDEDRKLGLELAPSANFSVAPNGVDTNYFQPAEQSSANPTLLFTGNISYEPNTDALNFFLKNIYPLIQQKCPDVRFIFAGRKAEIYASNYGSLPSGVQAAPNPADMRPWFEQASLCIVPLRSGGGTRLKILEAMAMKKAVVSTSIGAEGLPVVQDHNILLKNAAEDFAQGVIDLLQNKPKRDRIAENGLKFVRTGYDWKQITAQAQVQLERLQTAGTR